MAHIALYRTWRPQSFRDMVGQQHIVQTLQNALMEQRFSHAYLFSGPRGTGKTSAAKILAKAVNCTQRTGAEPCNACRACAGITDGAILDVVEIDAASNNGVDEIRDIRDKVKYAPTEVHQKVYIIDEVHMLTTGAFNALLKTLEEPPSHVMFILATTEPHKLPVTIISRCQRFEFRRVHLEEQKERLRLICQEEGIQIEERALDYIARLSDGGMRDALSLLDQAISFTGGTVDYDSVLAITGGIPADQFGRLAEAIRRHDIGQVLDMVASFMRAGKSADKLLENLMHFFRDLLMIRMLPQKAASETGQIMDTAAFAELAQSFRREQLFDVIEVLNRYHVEMRYSSQPQTLLEVALLKACGIAEAQEESAGAAAEAGQHRPSEPPKLVEELRVLREQVTKLEQRLSQLAVQGTAAGSGQEGQGEEQRARASRPKPSGPSGLGRGAVKLDPFLSSGALEAVKPILSQWSRVLGRVKDEKITVHAWLVDGEPVSSSDSELLVAFKNTIHRETTEKPLNKELIERVMQEVLGRDMRLYTVMLKEWKEAQAGAEPAAAQEEPLSMEALETPSKGKHKEEWINEAIELFGEELVVIKDNS